MKYKTRSIEVEAEQWNPQDISQTTRLQISSYYLPIGNGEGGIKASGSIIGHINGVHERIFIRPGDWVVVDSNSRVVMNCDEFKLKYELAEQ